MLKYIVTAILGVIVVMLVYKLLMIEETRCILSKNTHPSFNLSLRNLLLVFNMFQMSKEGRVVNPCNEHAISCHTCAVYICDKRTALCTPDMHLTFRVKHCNINYQFSGIRTVKLGKFLAYISVF